MWAFYLHFPRLSCLLIRSVIIYSLYMSAASHSSSSLSSSSASPYNWQRKKKNKKQMVILILPSTLERGWNMQSLTLGCIQSVMGKKNKYKNIQNTNAMGGMEWWERCQESVEGKKKDVFFFLRPDFQWASSHSEEEEEGMKEGGSEWEKKREMMPLGFNRVTVWMQHTSLPLTNKAVREKRFVTRGGCHYNGSPVQCIVWGSASEHRPSIALVLLEWEDHTRDPKSKSGLHLGEQWRAP